jgi:hypothetical protein
MFFMDVFIWGLIDMTNTFNAHCFLVFFNVARFWCGAQGEHATAKRRAVSLTKALRRMVLDVDQTGVHELQALKAVLEKMKTMPWMPIQHQQSPKISLFPLPWKTAPNHHQQHRSSSHPDFFLARPMDCRPQEDAWLCSASCFIVDDQVPHDLASACPLVATCFTWNASLPLDIMAKQLVRIAKIHQDARAAAALDALPLAETAVLQVASDDKRGASGGASGASGGAIPVASVAAVAQAVVQSSVNDTNLAENERKQQRQLASNVFRLYERMSMLVIRARNNTGASGKDGKDGAEIVREGGGAEGIELLLRRWIPEDTPCIYVDHRFVEVRRCAFRAPPGLDARPHLYEGKRCRCWILLNFVQFCSRY